MASAARTLTDARLVSDIPGWYNVSRGSFAMKELACFICVTGILLAPALIAQSQTGVVATEVRNATGVVSFGGGVMIPGGIPGAPYSAEEVTETTQTLLDGTHITHTEGRTRTYRDSQGRTRTERQLIPNLPVPPPELPTFIEIRDPIAGVFYILDSRQKTARRMNFPSITPPPTVRPSTLPLPAPLPAPPVAIRPMPEMSSESLGTKIIDGIVVEGTRRTMTIPVGAVGNDRPISTITETWMSPELKIQVMLKTSDPRSGERITRLENLSRTEPDSSLFQVPPDYTIADQGGNTPGNR
jgi:hypothetical protein